jgi:hypothetical protein
MTAFHLMAGARGEFVRPEVRELPPISTGQSA